MGGVDVGPYVHVGECHCHLPWPFANDVRTRAKRKTSGFTVLYLDNVHKSWISGEDVNGMTLIVVELSDHA